MTPDRVLFIGSGLIAGYGVLSYDMTISGEIARQVSQITNRGMDADIVAGEDLDIGRATAELETIRLARYDAVVLMLGSAETMSLYPLVRWRRDLTALLDRLGELAPASLKILAVGVPSFDDPGLMPMGAVFAKHARALNGITEAVVDGRRNVKFVPVEPDAEDFLINPSRALYAKWAKNIVPALVSMLSADAPVRAEIVDEGERLAALLRLNLLDSAPEANIQELVDMTRNLFDASGAAFNLIDSDRAWSKAATGLLDQPFDIPRSESFCATTIQQSRLLVIEDMSKDPLYRDRPYVSGPPGVRFYAGYPVEAPNGQRVGSLCIIDIKARSLSKAEATLLRDLALRMQGLIWDRVGERPPTL